MLEIFTSCTHKQIELSFKDLSKDFKIDNKVQGIIFQVKDTTLPHKHFILNYDLAGRLLTVELGDQYRSRTIKLLERSFNGSIYIYLKNCENLNNPSEPVNYYYDYYNDVVVRNETIAKEFIEYSTHLLQEILNRQHEVISVNHPDLNTDDILQDAIEKYNYAGLMENRNFKIAYPKTITVLPPDVRPDLNPSFCVLQLTNGCWIKQTKGPCAFCDAYTGISYGEATLEQLTDHIQKVKKYCGRDWINKRNFFLSDGDPLKTKIDSVEYFNVIHQQIDFIDHIESFVTTATILSKDVDTWQRLKQLGLNRLYWGVESANDFVLNFLNKPQTNKTLYKAAQHLQCAGIPYTIIIMSGLGNFKTDETQQNNHVNDTVEFINSTTCDEVYVSKFKCIPNTKIHTLIETGQLKDTNRLSPEEEHRLIISKLNKRVKGSYGAQFV